MSLKDPDTSILDGLQALRDVLRKNTLNYHLSFQITVFKIELFDAAASNKLNQ